MAEVIESRCQCEFQEYLIDQSVLFCDEPGAVVFRAFLFGSVVLSDIDDLVRLIEEWVRNGANITIGNSVMMLDPYFPVTDNSLRDLECVEPSAPLSSVPPSPSSSASPSPFITIPIIIGVVAAIAVAVIVVFVVVAVLCCINRKKGKKARSTIAGLVDSYIVVHVYNNYIVYLF